MQDRGSFILILVVAALGLLSSCNNADHRAIIIKGTLKGAAQKAIVLLELYPDSVSIVDSVVAGEKGEFGFRIRPKEAGFYLLRSDINSFITLSAEPGESIEISGEIKSPYPEYTVKGSEGSELYRQYLLFTDRNQAKVDSLGNIFMESRDLPDFNNIRKRLDSAYYAIFDSQKERTRKFLSDNAGKLVSLLVINRKFGQNFVVTPGTDLKLFNHVDSLLMINYPDNTQVAGFHKTLASFRQKQAEAEKMSKVLLPGSTEPNLALPDASGKIISLSSLSGKPHLIYFWSSWNAPSRKMNLELVPVYNEFREQGFEIYSVTLDTQKETWINAYRLDKAGWINVGDLLGLESPAAKACGIVSIPEAILIGPDGHVVTRDIEPKELKTWLMTHFNRKDND